MWVRLQTRPTVRRGPAKVAIAGLMLGLWLGVMGLASWPRLHQLLHADAQQLNHECVAKLFASGQLLAVPACVGIIPAVFACLGVRLSVRSPVSRLSDLRLAASRAPPLAFFLQ